MMFTATALEAELLRFLHAQPSESARRKQIEAQLADTKAAARALDGCREKGFATQSGDSFALTEAGRRQI